MSAPRPPRAPHAKTSRDRLAAPLLDLLSHLHAQAQRPVRNPFFPRPPRTTHPRHMLRATPRTPAARVPTHPTAPLPTRKRVLLQGDDLGALNGPRSVSHCSYRWRSCGSGPITIQPSCIARNAAASETSRIDRTPPSAFGRPIKQRIVGFSSMTVSLEPPASRADRSRTAGRATARESAGRSRPVRDRGPESATRRPDRAASRHQLAPIATFPTV